MEEGKKPFGIGQHLLVLPKAIRRIRTSLIIQGFYFGRNVLVSIKCTEEKSGTEEIHERYRSYGRLGTILNRRDAGQYEQEFVSLVTHNRHLLPIKNLKIEQAFSREEFFKLLKERMLDLQEEEHPPTTSELLEMFNLI